MIAENIINKGFTAFHDNGWVTDHRALFFDIDTSTLFSSEVTPLPDFELCNLQSGNIKQVEQFITNLQHTLPIDQLLVQCNALLNSTEWTTQCSDAFEHIDSELKTMLLNAESSLK